MADLPGGASGMLCRDYKGKEADRLVTRTDPGVVALVAELRGQGRQRPRNWPVEDASRGAQGDRCHAGGDYMSQALNRLRAMVSLPSIPRQCRGPRAATADGWA